MAVLKTIFICGVCLHLMKPHHANKKYVSECPYGNSTYRAGQKFNPDPCTFCKCPWSGGRAVCGIIDCKWEPHCLKLESTAHQVCCPRCKEYGCIHNNEKVYRKGETVSVGVCGRCYCPTTGGRTICDVTLCPRVYCVDPVTRDGECCPVCLNGRNCRIGHRIIRLGQEAEVHGYLCRCLAVEVDNGVMLRTVCRVKPLTRKKKIPT